MEQGRRPCAPRPDTPPSGGGAVISRRRLAKENADELGYHRRSDPPPSDFRRRLSRNQRHYVRWRPAGSCRRARHHRRRALVHLLKARARGLGLAMSVNVIAGTAVIVAAVSAGIFLMVRSIKRGAVRSGRQEMIIEHQRGAIDAIDKAKQVEEAARSGADREWAERVRRKYRRP